MVKKSEGTIVIGNTREECNANVASSSERTELLLSAEGQPDPDGLDTSCRFFTNEKLKGLSQYPRGVSGMAANLGENPTERTFSSLIRGALDMLNNSASEEKYRL